MNRTARTALLSASMILAPLLSHAFEGNLTYEIRMEGEAPRELTYQMKGDKIRMNMPSVGDGAATLVMPAEKVMYVLMPDRKMAMKQALPDAAAGAEKSAPPVDFRKTGRRETIAGQTCTVYSWKSDESEGEVCNAEGLGTFYFGGAGPRGGAGTPAWAREAVKKGLFPLRTKTTDMNTGKTMEMRATKLEKTALAASLFQVPSGYKIMDGLGGARPAKGKSGAGGGSGAKPSGPDAADPAEIARRMQNATPEERQNMLEELQKAYGQAE